MQTSRVRKIFLDVELGSSVLYYILMFVVRMFDYDESHIAIVTVILSVIGTILYSWALYLNQYPNSLDKLNRIPDLYLGLIIYEVAYCIAMITTGAWIFYSHLALIVYHRVTMICHLIIRRVTVRTLVGTSSNYLKS